MEVMEEEIVTPTSDNTKGNDVKQANDPVKGKKPSEKISDKIKVEVMVAIIKEFYPIKPGVNSYELICFPQLCNKALDELEKKRKSDEAKTTEEKDKSEEKDTSEQKEKYEQKDKSEEICESEKIMKPVEIRKSDEKEISKDTKKSEEIKNPEDIDKSEEIVKSDEMSESDKTEKSEETAKSDKTEKSEKTEESDKTEKSEEAKKSEKMKKSVELHLPTINNTISELEEKIKSHQPSEGTKKKEFAGQSIEGKPYKRTYEITGIRKR